MICKNRILAVDDNLTNLAIMEEIFSNDFELQTSQDSGEAFQIATSFAPDVVLLDVLMPSPDGYEVCRRIKNHKILSRTQVIMVSGKTQVDERLRGYESGADDYVTKPFEEHELRAKVCAQLRTKSQHASICDQLLDSTGEMLEYLSHLRDEETSEHMERIRTYSNLLAIELSQGPLGAQIDAHFLHDLFRASPLHDIGKVAIPDAILRKPGALTRTEFQQMQQHTILGAETFYHLAKREPDTSFFSMAAEIARWHHESYDGSGYPDGLSGTEIPLSARIVKVADVFDALTSPRIYKPAWTPAHALQHIATDNLSKFDAVIVNAMLRVFEEFIAVCNAHFPNRCRKSTSVSNL